MAFVLKAGNGNQPLAAGTYEASLTKVEQASNADGPYLKWTFCLDCQGQTRNITGFTPMSLDQGSKTRFWVEALLGRSIKDQEEIDLERLYGQVCQLELSIATLNNGQMLNRVDRLHRRSGLVLSQKKEASLPPPAPEGHGDAPF